MTTQHGQPDLTREKRLIEELRQHPELMERFEAILELTKSEGGAIRSADEIEEMLVEEVCRLGNRAMHDWARGAEEPGNIPDEQAPVRNAIRYIKNRLDSLNYPAAIEKNLPIGSGLIESGHKHVLQARLKKPGCAWLPDNAHAMAQLRVLRANHQWTQLWTLPIAA
jgi:DNA topoisomerase VI subunit B